MAEKLYRSRCSVPGHGTWCEVARDIYPDKKRLSKLRRQRTKEEIQTCVSEHATRKFLQVLEKRGK